MKSAKNSHEARGKTLGIVGYGSIGAQLSVLAESLGFNVIYYDVITKLGMGNASRSPAWRSCWGVRTWSACTCRTCPLPAG